MDNLQGRLELHSKLVSCLGTENVYYQPPEGFRMKYPCIVYEQSSKDTMYADNKRYIHRNRYSITIIDRDPDSDIRDRIEELNYCSFDRHFNSDNLHHFVYTIYY